MSSTSGRSFSVIYRSETMPIRYCLDYVDEDRYEDNMAEAFESDHDRFEQNIACTLTYKDGVVKLDYLNPAHEPAYNTVTDYLKHAPGVIEGCYVLCIGGIFESEQTMSWLTCHHIYDVQDYDIVRLDEPAVYMAVIKVVDAD